MGRKLAFTSLFFRSSDSPRASNSSLSSSSPSSSPSSSWPWPSCKHPRTDSFRTPAALDSVYKTVNSVYFDSADSCFTPYSSDARTESFSTESDVDSAGTDAVETVIRSLRSDRLFFEPGPSTTSSILAESPAARPLFKESVAMAVDSADPYRDFRESMEEMVAAHGLNDWDCLEELLLWYLRVNGKKTHGFIVGAFLDLIVGLASAGSDPDPDPTPATTSSDSTALSSSCVGSSEIEEVEEEGMSESC